ncbi:MAG: hypothetical protein C4K60_19060 [Ideonella sp. MAG2]|nr:MAG: hypothetical protein C4K60_19060 [Ideonella sp. MAG2]
MTTSPANAGKLKRKSAVRARASADSTEMLLLTAQRLFAERGIDAVSLREIAREAGQLNNSALHYHFGSKDELIRAILVRGMQKIDALRKEYIERIVAMGRQGEVRAIAEAIVWPLASGLVNEQMSTYNRFFANAQIHPDIDLAAPRSEEADIGFRRTMELLEPLLPHLPSVVLRQRFLSGISFVIFSLADFERIKLRRDKSKRSFDLQRAIDNLVDMLCGALQAPVSEQVTQRLNENNLRVDQKIA